jgi:hypothetical protein
MKTIKSLAFAVFALGLLSLIAGCGSGGPTAEENAAEAKKVNDALEGQPALTPEQADPMGGVEGKPRRTGG